MSNKSLSNFLHQSVVYLFYTLFLVTPLIWNPSLSELFEFPKMVFVYAITILIGAAWISRMVAEKKLLVQKTPFDIPLLLFFFSQIISTILSIHPRTSIFGYYSRFHGGLLSTTAYLVLFYAFIAHFDLARTKTALKTILAGGIVSALYAIPEHFGHSISCLSVTKTFTVDCWVQDVQTRIFGTFGQPNWLAAYMISIIPITWAISLSKKISSLSFGFWSLVFGIFYSTLLFSHSKSGFVGFTLAFALFWGLVFLKTKLTHWKQFVIISSVLVGLSAVFGTEYTPSLTALSGKNSPQSNSQTPAPTPPTTGTVLETGGTDSGKIREIVWQGAIDVFKANPLFGSGVETFAFAYYNQRPSTHNLVSEWDFLYNKAHNEFLNFAATTGIAGLGSYLLVISWYVIRSLKQIFKNKNSTLYALRSTLPIALLSGYAALAVSNFFGFSTVAVALLFFLFPAIVLTLTETTTPLILDAINPKTFSKKQRKALKQQKKSTQNLSTYQFVAIGLILISALYALSFPLNMIRADLAYASAQNSVKAGKLNDALDNFQKALRISPKEPVFLNEYANTLSKAALIQGQNENFAEMTKLGQAAFQYSADTLTRNPVHLNFYKTQAGVYIRLSQVDPTLLETASLILEDAQTLAPTDAKITYNLALVRLSQENPDVALQLLEKAVQLKPNYESARFELAKLYQQAGEYHKAREQYQYILNHIAPENKKAQEELDKLQ